MEEVGEELKQAAKLEVPTELGRRKDSRDKLCQLHTFAKYYAWKWRSSSYQLGSFVLDSALLKKWAYGYQRFTNIKNIPRNRKIEVCFQRGSDIHKVI